MSNTEAHIQKCAAQHFGPWMVESQWFAQAVAAVKAGTFRPKADVMPPMSPPEEPDDLPYDAADGVAVISICGQIAKGESSFGGASSVVTRRAIRQAVSDDSVSAILLVIDSPGGTVAGTGDLAADVAAADKIKPVYTYFEDLGASAAYWVGCQARTVYANPTAQVGSIGTMTYVEDTSGAYEKAGIKVTLIATGKYKGQWVDGNPVSEDYIKELQTEVNDLNEHFLAGVMAGRGMSREQVDAVADGRCFIAEKAKQLGLIDEIASLDATMQAITQEVTRMTPESFRSHAAENPESAEVKEIVARGHKAGFAAGVQSERDRFAAVRGACGDNVVLAMEAFPAGHDADTVKLAADAAAKARADAVASAKLAADAVAAKDAEIAQLKEQVKFATGTQGAVATGTQGQQTTATPAPVLPTDRPPTLDEAKAAAGAEFDANPAVVGKGFSSKERFVNYRAAEMMGQVRTLQRA